MAEQTSQAVMESLDYQSTGAVWPACSEHGRGVSPEARDGTGVWWCGGTNGGHVLADIGKLPADSWIRTAPVAMRRPLSNQLGDTLRDNRGRAEGTRADNDGR